MANEDIVDATPRPAFTPKPRPAPKNHKNACLTPIVETSDGEIFDDFDAASFAPAYSEKSVADNDSAIENEGPPPPAKRLKVEKVGKAMTTARAMPVGVKVAGKRKKADDDADEIVPASEEELPQEPKAKKVKVKVRDEIDIVMKKMGEDKIRNKYSNMVKSVPSKHAGEDLRGRPAPKEPSQVQPLANRKLKREGAIADIKAWCEDRINTAPESSKRQQNLMDDNIRYILSPILMFPLLTLDRVTLHYWTLSDGSYNKQKHSSAIKAWASAVPNGNPTSRAPKSVSSCVPSLTSGASCSSVPSVLTDKVKIISHQPSDLVNVKAEPAPVLSLLDDGGLSDNDEMRGEEREAAINSPPKGKKRATNEVGTFCRFSTAG
jgi:hypothetical protein